ncbi:MAG: CarD family transcriptional regulator [Blautia massiliensis (ex Durand et al. 2017)]
MFETGEYVVYGRTGICQVTGVTTMKMDGSSSERLYYVLRPGGETEGKILYTGRRRETGSPWNHHERRSRETDRRNSFYRDTEY